MIVRFILRHIIREKETSPFSLSYHSLANMAGFVPEKRKEVDLLNLSLCTEPTIASLSEPPSSHKSPSHCPYHAQLDNLEFKTFSQILQSELIHFCQLDLAEGTSAEELPPQDWPMARFVGHFPN